MQELKAIQEKLADQAREVEAQERELEALREREIQEQTTREEILREAEQREADSRAAEVREALRAQAESEALALQLSHQTPTPAEELPPIENLDTGSPQDNIDQETPDPIGDTTGTCPFQS